MNNAQKEALKAELGSLQEGARELDLGMSNFDHSIDEGFADALKAEPCAVFGRHAAWDFNALVWWDGSRFVSAVYCYGSHQENFTADTLSELMELNNEGYGDA